MRIVSEVVLVHPEAGKHVVTLAVSVPLLGRPTYRVTVRIRGVLHDSRRYTSGHGQRWFAEAPSDLYSEGRAGTYSQARQLYRTADPADDARRDFGSTVASYRDRGYELEPSR